MCVCVCVCVYIYIYIYSFWSVGTGFCLIKCLSQGTYIYFCLQTCLANCITIHVCMYLYVQYMFIQCILQVKPSLEH